MGEEFRNVEASSKKDIYDLLVRQVKSLLESERDLIANMANISSVLYHTLSDINWAGFYLLKDNQLVLGPFQGLPACVRLPMGRGVCGKSAESGKTVIVPNVHEFEGHIACDSASNSEIVVPVISEKGLFGVLDLDSPKIATFDETDKTGLEEIISVFIRHTDFGGRKNLTTRKTI